MGMAYITMANTIDSATNSVTKMNVTIRDGNQAVKNRSS